LKELTFPPLLEHEAPLPVTAVSEVAIATNRLVDYPKIYETLKKCADKDIMNMKSLAIYLGTLVLLSGCSQSELDDAIDATCSRKQAIWEKEQALDYKICDSNSGFCTNSMGLWISRTDQDVWANDVIRPFIQGREILQRASRFLLTSKNDVKKTVVMDGRESLREYQGDLYCDANKPRGTLYFFRPDDQYEDARSKCYGTNIYLSIEPIQIELNCIYYPGAKVCSAQWITNIDNAEERLVKTSVTLPSSEKLAGLYHGDLIDIVGEISTINNKNSGALVLTKLAKVTKRYELAAEWLQCQSGCSTSGSPPAGDFKTHNFYRALEVGNSASHMGAYVHWDFFEDENFSLRRLCYGR
jgi:hypothetical protein